MPIYEYRCPDCEAEFERIVLGSSKAAVECPKCTSPNVEKLISSFAVSGDAASRANGVMDCACNPGTT